MTAQVGDLSTLGPATSRASARESWVDEARGLAILLVVFGHAWRGVEAAGLVPDEGLFLTVDRLIYSFHMPLFFLLSGLFLERTLLRASAGDFVRSRVLRLLWPLVLWSYVFAVVQASAGALANRPIGWGEVLAAPFPPKWHFWFLWALFLLQVALLAVRPLLAASRRPVATRLGLLGLALLLALFAPRGTGLVAALVAPALLHAPFLLLGVLVARTGLPSQGPPVAAAAGAMAAFALAEGLALARPGALGTYLLAGAVASLAACVLVLQAGRLPGRGRGLALLGHLGRASMAIFLAHTIFSAALRIALEQAGVESLPLHLLAGTAAGLLGPLLILAAARRTGTVRLLGL